MPLPIQQQPFTPSEVTTTWDALTPAQRDFLTNFLELGGVRGAETDAALAAGYGNGDRKSAKQAARALLKSPNVQAALKAALKTRFKVVAVRALRTLEDLLENGSDHTKLAAARILLEYGYEPLPSRTSNAPANNSIEWYLDQLEDAKRRGVIIEGDALAIPSSGSEK